LERAKGFEYSTHLKYVLWSPKKLKSTLQVHW